METTTRNSSFIFNDVESRVQFLQYLYRSGFDPKDKTHIARSRLIAALNIGMPYTAIPKYMLRNISCSKAILAAIRGSIGNDMSERFVGAQSVVGSMYTNRATVYSPHHKLVGIKCPINFGDIHIIPHDEADPVLTNALPELVGDTYKFELDTTKEGEYLLYGQKDPVDLMMAGRKCPGTVCEITSVYSKEIREKIYSGKYVGSYGDEWSWDKVVEEHAKWNMTLEHAETPEARVNALARWRTIAYHYMHDGVEDIRVINSAMCTKCMKLQRQYFLEYGAFQSCIVSHICVHRRIAKAQGKSKQRGGQRRKDLAKQGIVFEFGKKFNLKVDKDSRAYLEALDAWFARTTFPREINRFNDFVKSWSTPVHRSKALDSLHFYGNRTAGLFLASLSGQLTQERLDKWDYAEAQGLDLWLCVAMFMALMALLYKRTETVGRQAMMEAKRFVDTVEALKPAIKSVGEAAESVKPAVAASSTILGAVGGVIDHVKAAYNTVLDFFNGLYEQVEKRFGDMDVKATLLLSRVIKVVLVFVAFEYARSTFPSLYRDIKRHICVMMGYKDKEFSYDKEVEAQGKEKGNVLYDVLDFLNENVVKGGKEFLDNCAPLVKAVSVARALEWIWNHLGYIINAIVETWTGKPMPRSETEEMIEDFATDVAEFQAELMSMSAEEVYREEVKMALDAFELTYTKLKNATVHNTKVRPVFISRFAQGSLLLVKVQAQFASVMREAKPRAVPVVIYVHGKTNVGKSQDTEQLCEYIWQYVKEYGPHLVEGSYHPGHCYRLNQTEEFWDGYKGQFFCVVDDLLQTTDSEKRGMMAERFIQMVSPAQYALRVATVEDKSYVRFTSRVIVCTSNTAPKDVRDVRLSDATALRSRFHIVVEKLDYNTYEFGNGEQQVIGIPKRPSLMELAALVGEAVLYNEENRIAPLKHDVPPRFTGSFSSMRLKFRVEAEKEIEKEKAVAEGKEGKGKEKEDSVEEKIARMREMADTEAERKRAEEILKKKGWKPKQKDCSLGRYEDKFGAVPEWHGTKIEKIYWTVKWPWSKYGESMYYKRLLNDQDLRNMIMTAPGSVLMPVVRMPVDLIDWMTQICEGNTTEPVDVVYWFSILEPLMVNPDCVRKNEQGDAMFKLQYEMAYGRPSFGQVITLMAAGAYMIGYAIGHVVGCMMPKTAYAQSYDEPRVRTERETKQRAKRTRAFGKWFGKNGPQSQGGNSTLYAKINRNYTVIETRIAKDSQVYDDVKGNEPDNSSWALWIGGRMLMVPAHTLFSHGDEGAQIFLTEGKTTKNTYRVSDIPWHKQVANDVLVLEMPPGVEYPSLHGLFSDKLPVTGKMSHLMPATETTEIEVHPAVWWSNKLRPVAVNDIYGDIETDIEFHGVPNKKGDCGTVYIHEATGKIVAVHMGGIRRSDIALGTIILKDQIIDCKKGVEDVRDPITIEMGVSQCIEGVSVLGKLPREAGSFIPNETAIHLSKFDQEGFPFEESDRRPAPLAPFEKDGVRISPLQNAIDKMKGQEEVPFYGRRGPISFSREPITFFECMPRNANLKNLRKATIEEAIYGIEGYMKSVDFNTSPGYYFKKLGVQYTRRFLCFDEKGEKCIHPLLRNAVEVRVAAFERGEIYPVIFEETLKDELKSKEKADVGDTRLFSSGDFASLIVQRMYLGIFAVELMSDPTESPIAVTINAHSQEWGALHSRLRGAEREKRKCGAGDFKKYDISIKNRIKKKFKEFVEYYMPGLATQLVIEANFQGWHIMGTIVFIRPFGTSSGSFITTIFNTFGNWYMHKEAFVNVYSEDEWKVVACAFCGDDSVFSVPEGYEKFNMEYLQKFFKEAYGMEYTSPSKTSSMILDWEEMTFLKRRMVPGLYGIMAPLAEKSIRDMVKWTDTDQDPEVLESVMQSVLIEAWHYGKERYEKAFAWCRRESDNLGVRANLPTWEGMCRKKREDY